jgi:hypothetical protein
MFCPLVLVSEQTHSMFSTTAQVRAVAGVVAQILTSVTIDSQVGQIPKSFDYHPPRVSSIVTNRLPTRQSFLCLPLRKHHVFFICNVCSTACVLSILQIIPRRSLVCACVGHSILMDVANYGHEACLQWAMSIRSG